MRSIFCSSISLLNLLGKQSILTTETALHFKLYNNSIDIWEVKNIKSFRFRLSLNGLNKSNNESNGKNIQISVLNEEHHEFVSQEEFGHLYDPKEFVLLTTNTTNLEKVVRN